MEIEQSQRPMGADDPDDDPVAYFLQEMVYHGKSERTIGYYRRVLRDFERQLQESARDPNGNSTTPADATRRDCMAWVHSLRGTVAPSSIATYASYVHRFYSYMTQIGAFDSNPMALVTEEMPESINKDPARREISLAQMRAFVQEITHPLDRAIIILFLKTGIRVGELCNLDVRDVSFNDPAINEEFGTRRRPQLDGRPDSLFVAHDVTRGAIVNGERRTASNKRKRSTIVPLDGETKLALRRWLAIRPDSPSSADPLFTSTNDEWGQRITPPMVRGIVESYARPAGWYRSGGGAEENVTPHYFRHFFTTHLRDRTGDRGIVKYLRGDVADDIIDTYTHNWGNRVREVYEEHIYSLC